MLDLHYIKQYFENKKVILVGPANNLMGQKKGEFIDKFDIVCRLNSSFIISDERKIDYGSRCDVLFNTCNHKTLCVINRFRSYLNDCKIVVNPTSKLHNQDFKITKKDVYNNYLTLKLDIPFYQVEKEYEEFMNKYSLNTGMSTLFFLLDCLNLKELYICGFSFHGLKDEKYTFADKTKPYETYLFDSNVVYNCNCNKYSPCKKRKDKLFCLIKDEIRQYEYFKKITSQHKDKVIIDETITELIR